MDSMILAALVVGLLGGVHCLGMCGGVVGTLTFNLSPKHQLSPWRMLPFQLAYNLGRISSYVMIGAIMGGFAAGLTSLAPFLPLQQGLQFVAGVFMILLGIYLAGGWTLIVQVERLGQGVWQRIQPWTQKLTPVKTLPQAWLYGMVWGWLPCGLVYSVLIMALSSASASQGALVMLAFGLGTLPNLMLMGVFAFYFTRWARMVWVKRIAGGSVVLMGLWQIYLAFAVTIE
jgi:sulfite exporter TauE/SafE